MTSDNLLSTITTRNAMKTITSLPSIIAAVFLTGCATTSNQHDYSGKPPVDVDVAVTCSDTSAKFTGTILCDGQTRIISGVGSGAYHVTGHDIVCSFKKTDAGRGRISISATTSDQASGNSTTDQKFGGVRAEIMRTAKEQHDIFTTF